MRKEPWQQVTSEGSPVIAPAAGTVNQSFLHQYAGNVIQINHGGGWFTTYLHLQVRSVSAGQQVAQGDQIGLVGHTGSTSNGVPHLHFELAIDANGNGSATWGEPGTERVPAWFNGVQYGNAAGQTYPGVTSHNCGSTTPPPSGTYTVTTFDNAPGFPSPNSTTPTGTLNRGSNYVYCKHWGRQIGSGSSYNHWWLKTDLDSGSQWQNQYVSAYYLSNWGSDEALADNGVTIPTCPGGAQPVTQYWVTTFADAPGFSSPSSTSLTGWLYEGTSYVYCKLWGRQIGSGSSYNHWWLKTDLDSGSQWQNQYVSAYYLSNWGNDEAFADNGVSIPSC
jgi:hypothetical protein